MDFRREKRGLGKLEYFLIIVLVVVVIWAAWIMLEPLIRPAIENFLRTTFQGGTATPSPSPSPSPSPTVQSLSMRWIPLRAGQMAVDDLP